MAQIYQIEIALVGIKPKDKFTYVYDFDDDWGHTIILRDVVSVDESKSPVRIKGANAYPPDDCGLEALADESHPLHSSLLISSNVSTAQPCWNPSALT